MAKLTKQETIETINNGFKIVKVWSRMTGTYFYLTDGIKNIFNVNNTHMKSIICNSVILDCVNDGICEKTTYRLI